MTSPGVTGLIPFACIDDDDDDDEFTQKLEQPETFNFHHLKDKIKENISTHYGRVAGDRGVSSWRNRQSPALVHNSACVVY